MKQSTFWLTITFLFVLLAGCEIPAVCPISTSQASSSANQITWTPNPSTSATSEQATRTPIPGPVLAVELPDGVPVIEPIVRPGTLESSDWTLFIDLNQISQVAIDRQGDVWSAGGGGAVRWHPADGTYTTYSIKNGLKRNDVTALAAAPDGAMWLLTPGYLARFSDERWTNYKTPNNWYWASMAVTPDGDVWIGTLGPKGTGDGIYRFDGEDWSHFTTEQGLTSNAVDTVAVTASGEVLAAQGEVVRFTGQRWTPLGQQAYSIATASDGTVWLSDGGRKVTYFDGKSWHAYSIPDGNVPTSIAAAPNGILWISTEKHVLRFDGTKWTTSIANDRLEKDHRNPIVADSQGGAWVGTNRGLWHFDGASWQGYMVEELPKDVTAVAAAADGSVWFGTDHGASRFDGQTWQTYTTADGLVNDFVWQVSAASDGLVWLNPHLGLSSFDGTGWTHYDQVDFSASSMAASSGGVVWLTMRSDNTVYRFDGKNLLSYTPGFRWAHSITAAPENVTWFGVDRGMYRFDGENWTSYLDDAFGTSVTTAAAAPDGTLWAGGYGSYAYLARFDGITWTIYKLPGTFVDSVTISPNEEVWAAIDAPGETHGGTTTMKNLVIHFAHGEWTSYELEELGAYNVIQIAAASDGSVWIVCSNGILRIERQ